MLEEVFPHQEKRGFLLDPWNKYNEIIEVIEVIENRYTRITSLYIRPLLRKHQVADCGESALDSAHLHAEVGFGFE